MQFLAPIWFLALAAIGIPVAIHLWNIRPGKTLKVGSISLITEASKVSRRSLKLLDLLLLLLRCLLLAFVALFLASPVWKYFATDSKAKGWVMIPAIGFSETYRKYKPSVDSLIDSGYELRYFDSDHIRINSDSIGALATLKSKAGVDSANYWSVVKQIERNVPQGLPLYLYTPNRLVNFKGARPTSSLNLQWNTYTPADSLSIHISSAVVASNGGIIITLANSAPAGNTYSRQVITGEGNGQVEVKISNGQPSVLLKGSGQSPVAVDTAAFRLAIYQDNNSRDADYVESALKAVTGLGQRRALIRRYASAAAIQGKQDWLFWLSDKPVDGRISSSARHVFAYTAGRPVNTNSWIEPGHIKLFKLVASNSTMDAIWTNGYGQPVLSADRNTYNFYSRFNPQWSDLVWSEKFPLMMLNLLAGEHQPFPAAYDKRTMAVADITPTKTIFSEQGKLATSGTSADISKYFWIALALVFALERILTYRKGRSRYA